ncbi:MULTISPECIES: hypothetical protein [Pseudomonas]|uniref:hypothetical protein n=1 Tax=Pseudomonas TaxID=286 RepID=UPI000F023677|nr:MULTISPECIES: hypothetical protein [Pseudomonas]MBD8615152.1 hypothetical protein [Pseudomonas putida]MBD8681173.1 hypothetical protein [Pseudomonas sp. CFBP 13719]
MQEVMTLDRLHRLYKLGKMDRDQLGRHWDEIVRSLLISPPAGDVQSLVKWAAEHQERAQKVVDLFESNPSLAFEGDRLGCILMVGTDDRFRSGLFRHYLEENLHQGACQITCHSYAERPGGSLLGDQWKGSVISQFGQLGINPFSSDLYLSHGLIDSLDRDEVMHLISGLKDSIADSQRLSRYDQINLSSLLSAQSLMGQSSLIVEQCRSFWNHVAQAQVIHEDSALSSMAASLRGVITQTCSFDLYQVVINANEDIASKFPLHLELIILSDLTQHHYPARVDDNPDFPTFTLERVLGKSITTKKTQAWLQDWLTKQGNGPNGIDCLDEKMVFDAVRPLLDKHRDALMAKFSEFNPEHFSASEILRDIQIGRYFRVATRALLSESYRATLQSLPLPRLVASEKAHAEFFIPMLGGYFESVSEERISQAYISSRSIAPQLDFLCEMYRERFTVSAPGFLLKACTSRDDAVKLLKELEQRGIAMPAREVLQGKGIDPALRDEFLSRDIGI